MIAACQKSEFQSCIGYDQLIGKWESINSDTRNTIVFDKKGIIFTKIGLERSQKIKPYECYNLSYSNKDYIFFETENTPLAYEINTSIDTIIAGFGAQDISEDTTMLFKMKFVKLK
ncbi:MAG: hypothetical protein ACO1O6_10270 [Bacteroidota bacterium]